MVEFLSFRFYEVNQTQIIEKFYLKTDAVGETTTINMKISVIMVYCNNYVTSLHVYNEFSINNVIVNQFIQNGFRTFHHKKKKTVFVS